LFLNGDFNFVDFNTKLMIRGKLSYVGGRGCSSYLLGVKIKNLVSFGVSKRPQKGFGSFIQISIITFVLLGAYLLEVIWKFPTSIPPFQPEGNPPGVQPIQGVTNGSALGASTPLSQ